MEKEYIPKYVRIRNEILNKIANGVLKKGDVLPPEPEMAKQFGVARVTIVGAMRQLVKEGVVIKRKRLGTIININSQKQKEYDIFAQITSSPKIEISYGLPAVKPAYEFMVRTLAGIFQVENPDVKVNVVNIPWPRNNDADPILLRLGSGGIPAAGAFFMHSTYAAMNALVPLEKLEGFQEIANVIHPQCIYPTYDADGMPHVHALKSSYSIRSLMVNEDFLRSAGVRDFDVVLTEELLLEWIAKASEYAEKQGRGDYGYFMETPLGWHGVIGLLQYLWQGIPGAEYASDSQECFQRMFSTPECETGLRFLSELRKRYPSAPRNGLDLFAVGKVGVSFVGYSWSVTLNEMMASPYRLRVYPYPPLKGRDIFYPVQGGVCEGIFRAGVKNDAELDAAWRWIKFLFRKEQQYLLSTDYSLPARPDCGSLLERNYPDLFLELNKMLPHSRPQFDFKHVRACLAMAGNELTELFAEQQNVEKTLLRIRQRLSASLF